MRVQKMLLKLQWYDFTLRYRKGKDMAAADALSRAFLSNNEPDLEIADVSFRLIIRQQGKTRRYQRAHR